MAFSHIVSVNASGNSNTVTSANVNTTGAKIICISVSYYTAGGALTISDSQGNTWIPLTAKTGAVNVVISKIYYCINPSVSATHNFTSVSSGGFSSINVSSFSAIGAVTYDVQSNSNTYTSLTSTNCTLKPTYNNSLIFTSCITWNGTSPISVNSGFTIGASNGFFGGLQFMNANGYLIQGTSASVTPQFTWTTATNDEAQTIASFYEVSTQTSNFLAFF
jgi:hypothetical protein